MEITKQNIENIKKDFLASIVVFLVALPLCLGVALASGFSINAGIISGIIGGLVVGRISGCPLQVSGPAAGLILICYELVQTYGFAKFGLIVFIAGLIQMTLGLLKLGQIFRAVSPAIIQGMLTGIGISILFSQFHIMLDDVPKGSVINNIMSVPQAIISGIYPFEISNHHLAAGLGILTIGIILLWAKLPTKYKVVPSALVAVFTAVIVSNLFNLPVNYINVSDNIFADIKLLSFSSLSFLLNYKIIIASISVAFIASAETLISSSAIDKMSNLYKTDYNKEIFAQGIGNIIAGFLGVLPITGVIVRSAANIQSGAVSRNSTIFHGLWLLLFILCLPFILKLIPTACLAAILVYTGYKLINLSAAKKIYTLSKGEFAILLITIFSIILTNLLEGILIGLFASFIKNTYKSLKSNIHIDYSQCNNIITLEISGNLSFIRLSQINSIIDKIEPEKQVIINFEKLNHIDHACIDTFLDWSDRYRKAGGTTLIDWESLKRIYPSFGWDKFINS